MSFNPHLILDIPCLQKDLHASMEVPPEPWPNVVDGVGDRGLKGGALRWCWTSYPGKGLAGGTCFASLLLCGLGLGVALAVLGFGFTSVHLPCSAWCGRGCGLRLSVHR